MSTEKSRFQQLTKNLIAGKNYADNREDRYAVAVHGDTQSSACMYSAWTPLSNFARILYPFLEHDGTITGRGTGNLS